MPQRLASLEMLEMGKVFTVTLMMGTNDVSRGETKKTMRLPEKVSCIHEELRVYLDPTVLAICTVHDGGPACEEHERQGAPYQ